MKRVFSLLVERIYTKPGLLFVLLFVFLVFVLNIKPDFYLLGWDNYSSYFNIPTNIFRTLFSSWRQYRGLGVPSDSEVVDVFRQIFFLILSPLVQESLLDQLYILFSLAAGVLGMYVFVYMLLRDTRVVRPRVLDITSAFAALLYACNLNTLAIFYFPIVTYISRFYALPLTLLCLWTLVHNPWKRTSIVVLFILLICSSSYITATVFITTAIVVLMFLAFQAPVKKTIPVFIMDLGINAFWILPFVNYTLQKSGIIRLAPTFIEANESQLNKSASFYDMGKQSILYPNFFDTLYKDQITREDKKFHPLSSEVFNSPTKQFLLVFPLFYALGSILIFVRLKAYRHLLWVPFTIFLYLFLTLKEYSFLGFLYSFLDTTIPYFGVLFRFGDTKFHPYIGFAGSIAAAVFLAWVLQLPLFHGRKVKRLGVALVVIALAVSVLYPFRSYVLGQLMGYFMYVKVPSAYRDIAREINVDQRNIRVLHLPFDRFAYWRSYSWGTIGSSFFHYFLNKPFVDKTFEPGSVENADLHGVIADLLQNIQFVDDKESFEVRVLELYHVLKNTGVGYVVLDQSVSSQLETQNILWWGRFNYPDAKKAMEAMVALRLAQHVGSVPMIELESRPELELYRLESPQEEVSFASKLTSLDPKLSFITASEANGSNQQFVQGVGTPILFPFYRRDGEVTNLKDKISLSFTNPYDKVTAVSLSQREGEAQSYQLQIKAKRTNAGLQFSFIQEQSPVIATQQILVPLGEFTIPTRLLQSRTSIRTESDPLEVFLSNWHILENREIGELRLAIDDVVMPVPAALTEEDQIIGRVVVHHESVPVTLLVRSQKTALNPNDFVFTDEPNCFLDKIDNYQYSSTLSPDGLTLSSQNGSTCISRVFDDVSSVDTSHAELRLTLEGKSIDLDDISLSDIARSSKPLLKQAIRGAEKPNFLRICLQSGGLGECNNIHQMMRISEKTDIVVPYDRFIEGRGGLLALLSLKNTANQKQELTIRKVEFDAFTSVATSTVDIPSSLLEATLTIPPGKLDVTIAKAVSLYTFYEHPLDGFLVSNQPCKEGAYRSFRLFGSRIVSYVENCHNEFFQELPFTSDAFLLWTVRYNLLSGAYPKFTLQDGPQMYKDEYLSLYQGYPDISGFKALQTPQKALIHPDVSKFISSVPLVTAYTMIAPNPGVHDERPKQFAIHENSENEGVVAFEDVGISDLPTSWRNLKLGPQDAELSYALPDTYSAKRVLPSLWYVDVMSSKNDKMMLRFNEGYDAQWRAYRTIPGVLFGLEKSRVPVKCNGFANCFEIPGGKSGRYFILYTPERLSFLGWGLTAATFICFIAFVTRPVRSS